MEKFCRVCFAFHPESVLIQARVCWDYFEKIAGICLSELSEESYLCRFCAHKMKKAIHFRDVVNLADSAFKKLKLRILSGDEISQDSLVDEDLPTDLQLSLSETQFLNLSGDSASMILPEQQFEEIYRYPASLKTEFKQEADFVGDMTSEMGDYICIGEFDPIRTADDDDLSEDLLPLSRHKRKAAKSNHSKRSKKPKLISDDETKYQLVLLSREEQIGEMNSQASKKTYMYAAYKCLQCFASFAAESMFRLHMSRHENVTEHLCDVCHCYFRSSHHLYQHTNLVHKKRYQCLLCSFRRKDKSLIIEHYNLEHGGINNNTQCTLCGKSFRKESSLKRHVCNQEKVKCDICDRFLTKLSLRQHIMTHMATEKRYKCSECSARFLRPYNLQAHERLKHAATRGEFYCAECDVSFKTEDNLKRHLAEATRHATQENLKSCPLCALKLPKWGVKAHINKHHLNLRQHKCELCPKEFFNKNSMVLHRKRTHEGLKSQRKYVCETCGKAFTTKRILKDHSNMHSGLRPYRCKYCDADFGHEAARYNHTRLVHLKLKFKPQHRKKKNTNIDNFTNIQE